jgi:hypothetical protein
MSFYRNIALQKLLVWREPKLDNGGKISGSSECWPLPQKMKLVQVVKIDSKWLAR